MNKIVIISAQFLMCSLYFQTSFAIYCYQCNSNEETYCSELFNRDGLDLEPSVCEGIYEVKYCIKATGMYEGQEYGVAFFGYAEGDFGEVCFGTIGTRRFCSSRHHGNYCEYVRRPGDEREYRSCVYTCSSDGCNGTNSVSKSVTLILICILSCIAWLMLN